MQAEARVRGKQPAPGQQQFYDEGNPAYALLQKANEALAGFPVDREGAVDWVGAADKGLMAPRGDVRGTAPMRLLDSEVIMKNTRDMPYVRFPHSVHTQWLACTNCHDQIFVAIRGANTITMTDIFRGRYCGVCHDKVAFSTYLCERCHNVAHDR